MVLVQRGADVCRTFARLRGSVARAAVGDWVITTCVHVSREGHGICRSN